MTYDDPLVGRVLSGRYELCRLIGRGGMAAVYRGWDTRLDRAVAVKVFSVGTAHNDARRHDEVNALARLNHPNLVTMHDACLAPVDSLSPSYLVLELVDGPDLRSELARGPLSGADTAALAADLAEGLVAVHQLGIVHRDLKPANILLAPTGFLPSSNRAKLADFGLAHLVGSERMTVAGTVLGTAAYLSPEQAAGVEPGPPADIYALGLVILECLTGRSVYPANVIEAVSARAAYDPRLPAGLPARWRTLIRQMTARDPEERPTAVQVAVRARELAPVLAAWTPSKALRTDHVNSPIRLSTGRFRMRGLSAAVAACALTALITSMIVAGTIPRPAQLQASPDSSELSTSAELSATASTATAPRHTQDPAPTTPRSAAPVASSKAPSSVKAVAATKGTDSAKAETRAKTTAGSKSDSKQKDKGKHDGRDDNNGN